MPDSPTDARDEEGGPQHMSPTVTQGETVGDKQLSAAVTQGDGPQDDAEQEGGG